jgi:copper chaperone CopZ
MEKTVNIEGMSCNHCKMRVEKALAAVPGVKSVMVDLAAGRARIQLADTVTDEALTTAVTDAGYVVTGIC